MKRSKDYKEQKTLLKVIELEGFIKEESYRNTDETLFIDTMEYPITKFLEENIKNKIVTVRYWISNIKQTKEQIQEAATLTVMGLLESEFWEQYSEITGYLGTDETLNVGGHDLLEELRSNIDNYIILEIEIYD